MTFPAWLIASFYAAVGLAYGGPVLVGAALLILAVPEARRSRDLRRLAFILLGVCGLLLLAAIPVLVIRFWG